MRGTTAAAVVGGARAARRNVKKGWSLGDSYGFISWFISSYKISPSKISGARPRLNSEAVQWRRSGSDYEVPLEHTRQYYSNSKPLNSMMVEYGGGQTEEMGSYPRRRKSRPQIPLDTNMGLKIWGARASPGIPRGFGTYNRPRKELYLQKRQFHDYFVTNLPSSSLHPDSGPHHKLPRSASTPHTPGPGSTQAAPLSIGASRELTVVRIPLRKAKHHFGVSLSRGTRPYNEDAFQAGTLEIPAFAKRKAISLSRSKTGAMVSDGSGTSAESASGDPQVFYFAVFDGHGGNECSDFLSQELHNYIESAAVSFGLQSSLRDTRSEKKGEPVKRSKNIPAEPSATLSGVTESKQTPIQLERKLVMEWKETVGGYFRRFKPEYFAIPSASSRTSAVTTVSETPVTIEPVLMYAFLKADFDFITAQAHKPDPSDNSDKPLNADDILGSPAHLSCNWIGGPTRFIGGSTASIALISTPTPTPFWHPATPCTIVAAHVGDTRIILCDTATGLAKPITTNHHPSTPLESTRLRRYAATFSTDSFGEERMSGLANTRAFGDMRSKRIGVSAEPEITRVELLPAEYSFLVLVSDGVSGTLDDQEIVDVVKEAKTPEQGARDLTHCEAIVVMARGRPAARGRGKGKARNSTLGRNVVPEVYRDMLAEAMSAQPELTESPLKRRRTTRNLEKSVASDFKPVQNVEDENEEEDIEFEDVLDTSNKRNDLVDSDSESDDFSDSVTKKLQTAYRDSEDESSESDIAWDDIDFDFKAQDSEPNKDLELTLTTKATPQAKITANRRKAITKSERNLRLEIHKTHVLCLLAHVDRRNDWCNDLEVQRALKSLLDKKMITFLKPKAELSQFGRAESLKRGLDMVSAMWLARYTITSRGMRKSLWAENEKDLQNFRLPTDAEPPLDKADFRAAARSLKGSRDTGAQLYCALLRSVGLDVRLVCSLQPLPFNSGGPSMPVRPSTAVKAATPEASDEGEAIDIQGPTSPFAMGNSSSTNLPFTARRRLGHPNAADYYMPEITAPPPPPPPRPKQKLIRESPYPVYWVEVLDEAHQKWIPVDPLVTQTIAKPRIFEPPASDRENNMSYVIAFYDDGAARDVTRRYAKAYNAKTRKSRVECTEGGEKWWRRVMRSFSRGWTTDKDQIEETELAAAEAREPMPRNVADFKDHPYYALERHLRRNEVLVSNREVGKIAAGRDPRNPGQKLLESIYRRKDVRIARSADAWYRLGREIKMGEHPVKTVAPRKNKEPENEGDDPDDRPGTNLYTMEQTELYVPPPIVNGRVPKNSYGNLDIYVPTMVPKGGVHLPYPDASRAARVLGIDYADALTGFEFKGRHGTAILKGVIVAEEYREALEAVVRGFQDDEERAKEEMHTLAVFRMWKRFLVGLRIKERIDQYEIEGEDTGDRETGATAEIDMDRDNKDEDEEDYDISNAEPDSGMDTEEYDYDDDGGGGFFPE
ncbi:hypothetical protein B7463_g8935, partial [Scytalidium lignicola]